MTAIGPALAALLFIGMWSTEWPTYPVADAPAEFRPAIQRGDLVIVSLQSALLRELRKALGEGGLDRALAACHLDAAGAAFAIARREGIAAGRTSVRLRNPTNAPPPWAAGLVSKFTGPRRQGMDGFVVDLGDRIGLLRPIVEQSMCGDCHGPVSKLQPGVRAQLADRYPADRAVDFENGEIRGWYWVEIPKR